MSIRIWHVIMYPRHTDDYNIMMSTNHTVSGRWCCCCCFPEGDRHHAQHTSSSVSLFCTPERLPPDPPGYWYPFPRRGGGGGVRTGCRLAPSPPSPRWVFKTAALTARVLHQMDSPDRVRQPETVARVLRCGNRKVRPGARSVGRGRGCQKAPGEWCQRCNRRT